MTSSTGEPTAPRSGCTLLFLAVFSGLQLAFLGAMGADTYQRIREFRDFRESTATVLATRILEQRGGRGGPSYTPEVAFEFPVDGRRQVARGFGGNATSGSRAATEARLAPFTVGSTHPCWFDPADPTSAVLVRSLDRIVPFLVIPTCLALVGLVMLIHTWTQKPLGRLGGTLLGVTFSIPWIAFATGVLVEGSDSVMKTIVFGGCFGAVGLGCLIATVLGLIPKIAARLTSPGRTPP